MNKISLKESISSKKFIFVIGCVGALFGFAVTAAWKLVLMAPMYDAFVGGVIALAGLYLTGNVANKFVLGRNAVASKGQIPGDPIQPVEQVQEESADDEVSPDAPAPKKKP